MAVILQHLAPLLPEAEVVELGTELQVAVVALVEEVELDLQVVAAAELAPAGKETRVAQQQRMDRNLQLLEAAAAVVEALAVAVVEALAEQAVQDQHLLLMD